MRVRLQQESFDPGAETNRFLQEAGDAGAMVTFTGLVRTTPDGDLESLTLEHYPELALRQIEAMVDKALARFQLLDASVIHRFGELLPKEPIVQVMTLAHHRREAFLGAEYLMDYLKTDAPFWKLEKTPKGGRWVAARTEDDLATARWKDTPK